MSNKKNTILNFIETIPTIYFITILIVTTFVIYANSLFNGFVWDSEEMILKNRIIQNINNLPLLFQGSIYDSHGGGLTGIYYRPLMLLSFMFNYLIWGPHAFGFHLFSVFMHTINGILVFFLLNKLFSFEYHRFSRTVAFFLTLIFIVHPANVESVANIASTQELLYTFFILITLLLLLKKQQNFSFTVKTIIFISLSILFSLLSKEAGIIIIPLLISFSCLFNKTLSKYIIITSIIAFSLYFFLRFGSAHISLFHNHSKLVPIANASLSERVLTIPYELFSYIRLFFFPKDLFTSQHVVIKSILDPRFYILLPIILFFIFSVIYSYYRIRSKLFLFFLTWIVFSFFMLINLYPLDMTVAERWMYGPMTGCLGLLGILILHFVNKRKVLFKYMFLLFIIVMSFFSIRTIQRNSDWKENATLYSHDLPYSPESHELQNNFGFILAQQGKYKESEKYFKNSVKLAPAGWTAYNNLGVVYDRLGKPDKALKYYEKSIANGDYYLAYENISLLKIRTEEPKNILPFLQRALQVLPENEILNKAMAYTYYKLEEYQKAQTFAQKAYKINNSQMNLILLKMTMNEEN